MSRLLVDLLGVRANDFAKYIERLENVTMRPSVDIRLSAELETKVKDKIKQLNLSSSDTTSRELYHALVGRVKQDDYALREALGINKTKTNPAIIIAKTATKLSKQNRVLGMSSAGVKKVLLAVPPRKTLRLLKLRSLDAVLKREDPRVLYALAMKIEDSSWRSQVHAKMHRLPSKDIGWQKIETLTLPENWIEKVTRNFQVQTLHISCGEAGVIVLLPLRGMEHEGACVLALGILLHAVEQLTVKSLPYRRHVFLQGYEHALSEIAHGIETTFTPIHGLTPGWHVVYELFGRGFLTSEHLGLDFALDDIEWETIETKLKSIVPSFDFWIDNHYLGLNSEPKPVSFHLLDVALAAYLNLPFGEQHITHMERSLWNELQLRYLQQEFLHKTLVNQLTQDTEIVL